MNVKFATLAIISKFELIPNHTYGCDLPWTVNRVILQLPTRWFGLYLQKRELV